MHIAAIRPPHPTTTTHANLHGAGGHALTSRLRPRITEDVSSGAEDSESLWMASAWRGDSGSSTNEQSTPAATTNSESTPPQKSATDSSAPAAPLPTGSQISYWA